MEPETSQDMFDPAIAFKPNLVSLLQTLNHMSDLKSTVSVVFFLTCMSMTYLRRFSIRIVYNIIELK